MQQVTCSSHQPKDAEWCSTWRHQASVATTGLALGIVSHATEFFWKYFEDYSRACRSMLQFLMLQSSPHTWSLFEACPALR